MKKFSVDNLTYEISKVILGMEEAESAKNEVKSYILNRMTVFQTKASHFLFEANYVEPEWKDMVGLHYINTSYKIGKNVMRVHLFDADTISKEHYVGFFTLRQIDEIQYMLSYIYPNFLNMDMKKETYIMTYMKTVHVSGMEISFKTYPLLVQDNMVISCSQASIISFAKYLHHKYDFPSIKLQDINERYVYGKIKSFPTKGLDPLQMLEILCKSDIGVDYKVIRKTDSTDNTEEIQRYIDYTLESALPILMGVVFYEDHGNEIINRHLVQIIGYQGELGIHKKYVIFDDSGKLAQKVVGKKSFMFTASWQEIVQKMVGTSNFIMYPIFERVYILYEKVTKIYEHLQKYEELKNALRKLLPDTNKGRSFLVDNSKVKEIIYNNEYENESENWPHYLWCVENEIKTGSYSYFVFDPTYHANRTKGVLKQIVITGQRIVLLDKVS